MPGLGLHLGPELMNQLSIFSLQEHPHLVNHRAVLLTALVASTGGQASLYFKLDAGPLRCPVNLNLAVGQWKDPPKNSEGLPKGIGWNVGTIVKGPIPLDPADNLGPRI